ncbi:hypothetical protein BO99DRAFT_224580 [Aspergillus violaceofuscus CBS 115571]|uniref:Uncharacterized protein n=1 Tax=Aspergillus violaceofuscus (strain CBS 115571) TaxID=1450538 RepID=A0A2V5HFP1_ASPV1|nr:hypothetical protein BO99DRAFT_224580 [Aspergillus violaceofuscus CBS 115571]
MISVPPIDVAAGPIVNKQMRFLDHSSIQVILARVLEIHPYGPTNPCRSPGIRGSTHHKHLANSSDWIAYKFGCIGGERLSGHPSSAHQTSLSSSSLSLTPILLTTIVTQPTQLSRYAFRLAVCGGNCGVTLIRDQCMGSCANCKCLVSTPS